VGVGVCWRPDVLRAHTRQHQRRPSVLLRQHTSAFVSVRQHMSICALAVV
jgi:hypothetical protein